VIVVANKLDFTCSRQARFQKLYRGRCPMIASLVSSATQRQCLPSLLARKH
jgi:hypothetical protein